MAKARAQAITTCFGICIPLPSRLNMQLISLLYASPIVSWGMLRGSEGKLCGAACRDGGD